MIMLTQNNQSVISTHPCLSEGAHGRFGRIHLPVAPACNIQCRYCVRKYDCAHESRPGITSRVLTPEESLVRVRALVERNERLSVVGIAGPGDALANSATYHTLRRINHEYPDVTLCLSTNGLLLPDRLDQIIAAGVRSLTITINAVSLDTAAALYAWVEHGGKRYQGREGVQILIRNQWQGLFHAVRAGMIIKINTVLVPGVNETDIPLIAERAGNLGAYIMNILPLIPQAEFKHLSRPDRAALEAMRERCRPSIRQMSHCRQCRADACGQLGEDKDMELEVLMARIGEEYADSVL